MTASPTVVLTWRYLVEYARRPMNLVLLGVVPVVFVTLAAGTIADFARILGGEASLGQLEAATAGWASAFLAGVAGFFHVSGSVRQTDDWLPPTPPRPGSSWPGWRRLWCWRAWPLQVRWWRWQSVPTLQMWAGR